VLVCDGDDAQDVAFRHFGDDGADGDICIAVIEGRVVLHVGSFV
jgi:hypothetical protein